jgi:hypothetical protein
MRRILLVLPAAMVMALMMVAISFPAFAVGGGGSGLHCLEDETGQINCQGGAGSGGGGFGGGFGGNTTFDPNAPAGEPHAQIAGGGGSGGSGLREDSGGSGGNCESFTTPNEFECVGHPALP